MSRAGSEVKQAMGKDARAVHQANAAKGIPSGAANSRRAEANPAIDGIQEQDLRADYAEVGGSAGDDPEPQVLFLSDGQQAYSGYGHAFQVLHGRGVHDEHPLDSDDG